MMNATQHRAPGVPQPSPEVREQVRAMLLGSDAFRQLPAAKQQEIARHTVEIADYLTKPEGIPGHKLPSAQARQQSADDPYALSMADSTATGKPASKTTSRQRGSNVNQEGVFTAQGAREGAEVAGALLSQVDFPGFVSGLIEGVFHSIVKSSIEQMEAYGKLVADVAKTLNQFRDDNVSVNQGRDHLVDQFPDTFMIDVDTGEDGVAGPRVRLRDGVDEKQALEKVNSLPLEGGPVTNLDDETIEGKLVPAARTQLATSRQQLLATMVLMGINRIVVTDGRISAKVLYDFQARDNFKFQKSATQFDYGDQYTYNYEGESETDYQGGDRSYKRGKDSDDYESRDASYYTKGKYKGSSTPVLKLASATQQSSDASLTTKASLAGQVEVNFKSDYLPLEKMADSFQIGRIQDAAKPGQARPAGSPAP
ncbi:MAG TPA: hypothetical protein VJ866_16075, partial [Pyrinomonadaceae bacterium]|nr:hypothetical protein [Pyrinomonadaceae bacterium]